jgi:uncharacterized protein
MPVTAFLDNQIIATGDRADVTRLIEDRYPMDTGSILAFDDFTGKAVDLAYWTAEASEDEFCAPMACDNIEIRLLPRHWQWLNSQPRGATATLRRLVEAAMLEPQTADDRAGAAYHFMAAMCGNRPNYEEALRALYRFDLPRLRVLVSEWPLDLTGYLFRLLAVEPSDSAKHLAE